ncbi:hypothetical protein, partial [Ruegeria sp. HKCCD7255]|uniref:hypothetical protein n=1 Tax=Ruegeria sp. HKCCD7255 TaxID=2683004 RepID=UPI001C2C2F69
LFALGGLRSFGVKNADIRSIAPKDCSSAQSGPSKPSLQCPRGEQVRSFAFTAAIPATGPAGHFRLKVQPNKP